MRHALTALLGVLLLAFSAMAQSPTDSAIARATEALMAQGYWSAHVDSSGTGLVRGPLFHLREVSVVDEYGRSPEDFSVREFSGEAASRAQLEALQAAARRYYLNHGFPFAEIVAWVTADTLGAPEVDAGLRVRRGSAFKRGGLIVSETRSSPETVERLALWSPGEDFSQERMEKGMDRLRRGGYFDPASWTGIYRDSLRNVLYPVLRLSDAHANTIGGLLGYDSKAAEGGKLTGYLDIRLFNLFGTARDFEFGFDNRTGTEREVRAAYTEPWIFTLPIGVRLEGAFLQQDSVFWEWNQNAVFFRDLSFVSRLEAEFGAQANKFRGQEGTEALRSGVRLLFDARDRAPFTRTGYRSSFGVSGLRRQTGDSTYFLAQGQASGEYWKPLPSRFGLKLSARSAANFPLSRLNHGELYYVGGARSLRGYREREFQTNAYALAEGELQYWVGRRGILSAFVSPAAINRPVARYDWRGALGYGLGIELAQGDWSLALSYALNPERSFGGALLHVAVENRF